MIFRIAVVLYFSWFGLCCLTPLVAKSVFNIGNGTGLSVSVLMILYMIFMPKVNAFIVGLWQKKAGRTILSVLGVLCILGILVAGGITVCMIKACHNKPAGSETAVVLGCRVFEEGPSLMLLARLEAAYEYLEKNQEAKCIVSGGQGSDEPISEAECMYNWLVDKGIDKDRIYMEDRSTSTRENLQFSMEIAQREGLNKNFAIASNGFHCYRAGMIGRSLNISTASIPGKTPGWLLPTYYLRELYGVIYEWIV